MSSLPKEPSFSPGDKVRIIGPTTAHTDKTGLIVAVYDFLGVCKYTVQLDGEDKTITCYEFELDTE